MTGLLWALMIVPVLPLAATLVLFPHSWRSSSLSLRERTGLALRDFLVSGFVGLLAANELFGWGWTGEAYGILFVLFLMLVALPSGVWLAMYASGRFGGD